MTQPVHDAIYQDYRKTIQECVNHKSLAWFKQNKEYRGILEHVTAEQGNDILDLILQESRLTLDQVKEFAEANDRVGNPVVAQYLSLIHI